MMIELTLWIAALLSLVLALHPFISYPLSLLLFRRKHAGVPQEAQADSPLTFTICMCAYNEENVIERKAENLVALKAKEPGLQVLIYVDAASENDFSRHQAGRSAPDDGDGSSGAVVR